jgi:hypothetical protein
VMLLARPGVSTWSTWSADCSRFPRPGRFTKELSYPDRREVTGSGVTAGEAAVKSTMV